VLRLRILKLFLSIASTPLTCASTAQAIDVGTVKYVSAEAIRILIWVLGFMTFGYGTKEFEVTAERLGTYRPEDHIDNPKDYADNLDAREYDPRLRGPVNERVELAIDPKRGLKNYIASEEVGITTSAGHVRKLFTKCIQLGREYGRTKNEAALYEALRLMGTGLHCLEGMTIFLYHLRLLNMMQLLLDRCCHDQRILYPMIPPVRAIAGVFGRADCQISL
jgi:hypothetical protein